MGHRLRIASALISTACLLTACSGEPAVDSDFAAATETWRAEREARLTAPYSWLSLAGLHQLAEGESRAGSDPEADLPLPGGPAEWGVLAFDGDTVQFTTADAEAVTVDGEAVGTTTLTWRSGEDATIVAADGIRLELIDRGGRPFVRVRDPDAPSRRDFVGLTWFEPDPSWAIDATFEAHPEGHTLRIADVTGSVAEQPNPGAVTFRRDGEVQRLQAVQSSPEARMWFIFSDGTSGRETYGLGRFLYFDPPQNGRVHLDFNEAFNPPCAFNPHTTCPLPPPANRLTLRVDAGEKAYTGPVGLAPESVTRREP